ncbi:V-type ATP synthase subunit I [Methanocella sp. CWC-04]|uniref:A-type ATP synthase subunit I n=1 Tax=Methanooceanicella nereidis TaxID=2052831 RepID=A0AAP2RER4_9EURY|nr:V-type ATP synthase subunit I [Methanocella sp. CWC-04]MCD1295989.1 V-type ATP synthase subunit I [Methanocella sp. CWC-04]
MLEPQRMDKVLIVGSKEVMETTINTLHDINLLHMEDYTEEEEYFRIGKPLKSATSLSEKLLKLRSIKSYLGTNAGKYYPKQSREKVLKDLEANLTALESSVTQKMSEKSSLESEQKELAHREELLKPYEALGLSVDLLRGYENINVYIGTVPGDIEPVIKDITDKYEIFSAPYGKGNVVALLVEKSFAPKISEALMKNDFVEVEQLHESGDPAVIKKDLEEKKANMTAKLEVVNKELAELNQKFADFIMSSEELLAIDTQKAEAPLRFATSDNTFVIEGWVPKVDFPALKDTLSKATNDKVYITIIEPVHEKYSTEIEVGEHPEEHKEVDAPVKYNNPKIFRPIEAFTDLYGRPRYDEIDPTMIFAIVFPLFYGFILGDIAYGSILLLLGLLLKVKLKHNEGIQILINVMLVCAVSSIFFGILYGEFLGFAIAEPIEHGEGGIMGLVSFAQFYPHEVHIGPVGPFSLPIERMQAGGFHGDSYMFGIKDLLVFTCIIGVCQLMLGYILGFRNELKQHGLKTAILHKASWALVLAGGVALVWYVFPLALNQALGDFNAMDPLFLIGAIVFLIGFILLLIGEGAMGIIELTTPLSHTLSYTRLLAVGLSSVGIAFAINTIAAMLAEAGILGLIGAIIVFVLGHTVNLVLGTYAPFIQSLRLHYVEFYQKFYKSGGRIYDPFGYNRKYTED